MQVEQLADEVEEMAEQATIDSMIEKYNEISYCLDMASRYLRDGNFDKVEEYSARATRIAAK